MGTDSLWRSFVRGALISKNRKRPVRGFSPAASGGVGLPAAQLALELLGVHGVAQGGLLGDAARLVQAQDGLVHADHPLGGRGLDDGVDLVV